MPGPERSVEDDDILEEFIFSRDPVLSAREVADKVELSRQAVHKRLEELQERGMVDSKKPGGDRVWWITEKGRDMLASRR